MLLQFLPGTGGLLREAAQSSHPVGNGKWQAAADVRRVSTAWQQQLTDFAWLLIEIRLNESYCLKFKTITYLLTMVMLCKEVLAQLTIAVCVCHHIGLYI